MKLIKKYDFDEIHDSKFIIDEVKNNKLISEQLSKSESKITNYVLEFIDTFIFTIDTIDAYLSDRDIELICKNDERLKDHYKPGLKMSEIINSFKSSKFFLKIKHIYYLSDDIFGNNEIVYNEKDFMYQYDEFIIDTINKQIFFLNKKQVNSGYLHSSWNYYFNRATNNIVITIFTNYFFSYKAAVECVYPSIQKEHKKKIIGEIKINLLTNKIIKNETN